jgi:hypothetical protein
LTTHQFEDRSPIQAARQRGLLDVGHIAARLRHPHSPAGYQCVR